MKQCKKCGEYYPESEIAAKSNWCLNCMAEKSRNWRKDNPDKAKQASIEWAKANPEKQDWYKCKNYIDEYINHINVYGYIYRMGLKSVNAQMGFSSFIRLFGEYFQLILNNKKLGIHGKAKAYKLKKGYDTERLKEIIVNYES